MPLVDCPFCEGKGTLLGTAEDKHNPSCENCGGKGKIMAKQVPAPGPKKNCPNCGATMNEGESCPECRHIEGENAVAGGCPCQYCNGDIDPDADGQPSELKAAEDPKDAPPWETDPDEVYDGGLLQGLEEKGDAPDPLNGDGSLAVPELPKTALQLDEWDMQRGQELLEVYKDQETVKALVGLGYEDKEVPAHILADLHAAAYVADPQLNEVCVDKRRHEFIETLLSSSEFQGMRSSTMLNNITSELATIETGKQYVELAKADQAREQQREKRPAPKSDKEKEKRDQQDEAEDQNSMLQAVNQAVQKADQAVQEFDDMCRSFGTEEGGNGQINVAKTKKLFARVKNSNYLKRICELAGRYRRVAQGKQRQKTLHGSDDTVGVMFGNDLSKVLPHELSFLGDEDLELEAMRRYAESEMMVRDTIAVERIGKGPIVICVDESGSMNGDPICNAKAFCLAMSWIAKKQNRPCLLVGFSHGVVGTSCLLRPGKPWDDPLPDQLGLTDWLEHMFNGGTSLDVPFGVVPTHWDKWIELGMTRGKTDMILLTDGEVDLPKDMEKSFLAFKKNEQVRLISMMIGVKTAGPLKPVSDEIHFVSTLSTEDAGVQSAFSI